MKRAKKAKLKLYSIYEEKIYSVKCPHCHVTIIGDVGKRALVYECSQCGNPIDLRDKDGKRSYE